MNPDRNVRELVNLPENEQRSRGYIHTLREILQQPATWLDTCRRVLDDDAAIARLADGIACLVLTGSGSSLYAGACVRLPLQKELGITTEPIGAGVLVTHGAGALPSGRPGLLVSIARSGDSPESVAAVAMVLAAAPEMRHLVVTCNATGHLLTAYTNDPRVHSVLLNDRTNDRSLAMTSSVTNMALAARFLGLRHAPERYKLLCDRLNGACSRLLETALQPLADAAGTGFRRAVFLGSGSRFGAAQEAALKMLEMTDGRVATLCETYLGVRHGPLSFIHQDTLVVCFLSSDALLRAYETDLIRELDRMRLGSAKIIVGENIPAALLRSGDTAIECPGLAEIGDDNAPLLDVVVGQLLAFFRCLAEGLHPDSPSESGVINRVVAPFPLHTAAGSEHP